MMSGKRVAVRITDPESAKGKQLQELDRLAGRIRAPCLDQAVTIERLLTWIIAYHFCPEEERRILLYSLVINRPSFNFNRKIIVLDQILALKYPDLAESYPELTARLHEVRKFRNRIAHAEVDRSDEFLSRKVDDTIQLIFYKNGQTRTELVTTDDIRKRLAECSSIILALAALYDEIVQRVSANDEQTAREARDGDPQSISEVMN